MHKKEATCDIGIKQGYFLHLYLLQHSKFEILQEVTDIRDRKLTISTSKPHLHIS